MEIKKIYISQKAPCDAIKTGGLLNCVKSLQMNDFTKQIQANKKEKIASILKSNQIKRAFPTKLPNNYFVGKIITDKGTMHIFLFKNVIYFAEQSRYMEVNDLAYTALFESL